MRSAANPQRPPAHTSLPSCLGGSREETACKAHSQPYTHREPRVQTALCTPCNLAHGAHRAYSQPHGGDTSSPTAGTHPAPHPALRSPAQGSPRPAPLTGSPRAQLSAAGLGAAGLRRALGVGVGQPGGLGLPRPALVVARLDGVGPAAPAAHRGRRSQPPPRHHRVAPSPRRGTAPGSVRTRPRSRHGPLSLLVSHSLTLSAPSPPGVLSPLLPPLSTPSAGLPPSLRCPLPSLKSPSQSPSPLPPPFPSSPPPGFPATPCRVPVLLPGQAGSYRASTVQRSSWPVSADRFMYPFYIHHRTTESQ